MLRRDVQKLEGLASRRKDAKRLLSTRDSARDRHPGNNHYKSHGRDDRKDPNIKVITKPYMNQAEVFRQSRGVRQQTARHSERVKQHYDTSFPPLYARRVDVETAQLQKQFHRDDISVRQKLAKLPQQRAVVGGIVAKIEASVKTRGKGWMNHGQVIEELVTRGSVFEAVLLLKWYKKEESVQKNLQEILKAVLGSDHPGLAADIVQLAHTWQMPLSSYHIVAGLRGLKHHVTPDSAVECLKSAYQMCDWALAPSPENGNVPQVKDAPHVLPHMLYFAWRVPQTASQEVRHLVSKVCPAFSMDTSAVTFLTHYFAGLTTHLTPEDEAATAVTVEDALELLQDVKEVDGALMSSIIVGFREQLKTPATGAVEWEREVGGLKWKNVMELALRTVRPERGATGPLAHIRVTRDLETCYQLLSLCNFLVDNQLARNWFHNYVRPVVLGSTGAELGAEDKNGGLQILNMFNVYADLNKSNLATDEARELFVSVVQKIPNFESRPSLSRFIAEVSRLERIFVSKCDDKAAATVHQAVVSTFKRMLGGLPHTCVISTSLIKSWRYTIGDAARNYHRVPYLKSVLVDQLYLWEPKVSQNRSFLKSPENLWAVAELYELLQAEYVIMQRSSPKKTQSIQQLLHVLMHRLSAFVPGGVTPEIVEHHRHSQVLMNIISKKAIPMPYDSDGKEPQWLMGPKVKPDAHDDIARARVTKKFGARPKAERAEKTEKRRGTKRLRHKPEKTETGDEILHSMLSMPDQFKR